MFFVFSFSSLSNFCANLKHHHIAHAAVGVAVKPATKASSDGVGAETPATFMCTVCLGGPQAKPLCACAAPCLPGSSLVASATASEELESAAATRVSTGLSQLYEPNPGRSDASHIWRSLPAALRGNVVVPFTCGPGHRSHRDERAGKFLIYRYIFSLEIVLTI